MYHVEKMCSQSRYYRVTPTKVHIDRKIIEAHETITHEMYTTPHNFMQHTLKGMEIKQQNVVQFYTHIPCKYSMETKT